MNAQPPARPLYLGEGTDSVFGFLHLPASDSTSMLAVLISPPFGWEDICSYRSRRDWAEHLAENEHPVLRIDLPSTGDSAGSPRDPDRLSAWTGAITAGATRLRAISGCERVAAIGIGLGGLVVCNALSEGAAIDDVVLWGVPARGRTFTRELRAFARMNGSDLDPAPGENFIPPPTRSGEIMAGGFLVSAETTEALEALDLSTLPYPSGHPRRVLLLKRDGIDVDPRLQERLQEAGATVIIRAGPGYGQMVNEPHLARSPIDTFSQVQSWLDDAPSDDVARPSPTVPARSNAAIADQSTANPDVRAQSAADHSTVDLYVKGTRIRESPLTIAQSFGDLFAIVAEPVDTHPADLCAVMLNAGAIRRVGPNRMWVETSRRWAARGVPTVRLDLEGIGDGDGDGERFTELAELYAPELVDQVCAALDALEARGLGCHFVLAGLCSGACWSFHGALRDERVVAAFMLNPRALFWDPSLETARNFRRGLLRLSSWRRVLRGEVSPAEMATFARRAPFALLRRGAAQWRAGRAGEDELDRALDRLRDTGKHLQFIFSGNEPLHEELERQGRLDRGDRWPNLELALVPGRDHTLRSLYSQQHAHDALDRALDRELAAGARLGRISRGCLLPDESRV